MESQPLDLESGDPGGRWSSPVPAVRGHARRPLPTSVNLALFLLTGFTTLVAGGILALDDVTSPRLWWDVLLTPSLWSLGLPYSASVMLILGAHEMGHYVACRYYRIDATLPFFIPGPPLLGTFGAVIRIRAPFTTRKALFDIGVAGPLAGFVVALPVLAYGLSRSHVVHAPAPGGTSINFPPCLLLNLAMRRLFPEMGPDDALDVPTMFVAAWVGLLATFLNLLPIGQLDGGHMVYALSARLHRPVSLLAIVLLLSGGFLLGGIHLIVFGVIWAVIGPRHPPVLHDSGPLGPGRTAVALAALAILVLCLIPQSPQIF